MEPILTTGRVPLQQLDELEDLFCYAESLEVEIGFLKDRLALALLCSVQNLVSFLDTAHLQDRHESILNQIRICLAPAMFPPPVFVPTTWSYGTYDTSNTHYVYGDGTYSPESVVNGTGGGTGGSNDWWPSSSNEEISVDWNDVAEQPEPVSLPMAVSANDIVITVQGGESILYTATINDKGALTWTRHPP